MSAPLPSLPKEMEVLHQVPLFAALLPETFARLAQAARIERHAKGDIIFRQGDVAQSAIVVVDGFVKVSRLSANGDETLIHIFGRGESVGESAVVARDRYSTTAEAVGPAVVVRVPGALFIQMAREFPDLAFAIINEAQAKVISLMDEIENPESADRRPARAALPPVAVSARHRQLHHAPALYQGRHRRFARPEARDVVALLRAAEDDRH